MAADKRIRLSRSAYLGGLPGEKGSRRSGTLFIGPDGIGWGAFKPSKGVVNWTDVGGVSFESGTLAKSRTGAALAVGVLAVAAKNTQRDTHLSLFLKDGNVAVYQVVGLAGPALRAKVQPYLTAAGVPCRDDQPTPALSSTAPISAAEELTKLGALRDSGVLSDDEFAAEKAKLLNR